ncbi:MAG: TonB-dependent siderophore receptor [Burkholderiales bacterium]|nr:TonB-dependent siderophore receptor [Burkholderiales bacterium]
MAFLLKKTLLAPVKWSLFAIYGIAINAWAQDGTLAPVTVSDRSAATRADVTGLGDSPLRETPVSATVVGREQMADTGARRLADLTKFDASVTDAYNSPGYWDFLSVRGFTLDNRFNYRREGLPISAETSIPLDNKERVEILKGTSGLQAGTSAPGGLVNYVVKRPTQQNLRDVKFELSGNGSALAAIDFGGRLGEARDFGYRLNLAHENLQPRTRNADGQRSLAALATDWRVNRDAVLEAEIEWSHKRQPSQQGFSLLGNTLPAPVNPRLNLNNQPWSQPSVFDALTGSLRFEQALGNSWRWSAQVGSQRLKTDDRLAFGFGCGAEGHFDRFCSDGTFDLYDFRSENERRNQHAANLNLTGQWATGRVRHDLSFGLQASRLRHRFQPQAFNFVGTGNVAGTLVTPADPSLTTPNTNRNEYATELSASDAIRWTPRLTTWLGLRTTHISRSSVRTDGTARTDSSDTLSTPWAAVSYLLAPGQMVYASYGEGVESQVVPNLPTQFTNAGESLPALKSRQIEAGFKGGSAALAWQLAAFRIVRPMTSVDACNRLGIAPCEAAFDGDAVHRGVEASVQYRGGPWRNSAGATYLLARRHGSVVEPATNGQRPANVPQWVLRTDTAYRVAALPGLELQGQVLHEGPRTVLPGQALELPSWTRIDAALRYDTKVANTPTTWSLGVDNLLDRRYWKESPFQFGHVYLFPGASRTLRLSVQAAL